MERKIYGYKCPKCGHINYPYRMRCRKCKETEYTDFEVVPLPLRGKLLTYTKVYNLPADYMVANLALGIVELENGVRVTGQLKIPEPRMGMEVVGKVEAVRSTDYEQYFGMTFSQA